MSADNALERTPLYEVHRRAGARIVPFAGFEMPVQYTGIVDEHRAVRTRAGLFDVSHMGEVTVRGGGALEFLQHVTSNNVARLADGRAQYSALTLPNGAFVDDLLVYRIGEGDYFLVVNASNRAKDVAWLKQHADPFDVVVEDVSDAWAQLALQGPEAGAIAAKLCGTALLDLPYYGFRFLDVEGARCLVSRTGYTGEDGFEFYVPSARAVAVWDAVLGAGAPHGAVPVGLGARDTLRLEAKMALYGNDIDDRTTVLEAGLGWIVKWKKGPFIGREALERQKADGLSRKLVGFRTHGRSVARHGYATFRPGGVEPVGVVTSGTFSPTLGHNIGLAYLPPDLWTPGSAFEVAVRTRREPAEVVETPFYKRDR